MPYLSEIAQPPSRSVSGRAIAIKLSRFGSGHPDFPSLNKNKNMFKEILAFMLVLVIVKIALPSEVSDLILEILLKILTLIRDAVNQAPSF